jgi:hypothetical protein
MATATRTALSELTDFCEMTYGVPRLETRILVSTFLATRYPPLWLMIDAEKCRFLHDLEYALQRLRQPAILDTLNLRGIRTRLANKWVQVIMSARDRPHLFANRYWDGPGPWIRPGSLYPVLAAECLRLRLTYNCAKQPGTLARENLYELVRRVLNETDPRGGVVPREPGETFSRRAALLPMMHPELSSPTALMRNFGFVLANHAAISGRSEPNEEDFGVQRFMMRYAIPLWVEKILQVLLERGMRPISWRSTMRQTGQADEWHWQYGKGSLTRPVYVGRKIIFGFWASGLLHKDWHSRFIIKPEYADDLEHIMEARA